MRLMCGLWPGSWWLLACRAGSCEAPFRRGCVPTTHPRPPCYLQDAQETAGCDPHARVAQLDAAAAQQDEAAGVAEVYQLMLIGLFQV